MKNNLEAILKEQGRMKGWLAQKANVRPNTITELIKGAEPKLKTAYRIAKPLGKSVYDIWPDVEEES
ncbi:helix-turn-helix domain-containing protein [Ornithinibacillus sp. L9]|uniref:Helix-turn-helix domain-containing protein n=1 Tax=Ornithinibacillus caprae TaxID=2678566 RepID=A0A6N8FKD3_9BACI|nr:helix-turn-helix domain-containing protein [Ornithinibacillus caprae]